ncbi:MAG: LytTR family DNA-binding domain-containing protein [Bacteroidales bacterium]|jgi:DNA-binding LytR/AlgR family response regulator|nr:LytTR family DNA-binding domain-containing protein [Bacteroidales bacterium]
MDYSSQKGQFLVLHDKTKAHHFAWKRIVCIQRERYATKVFLTESEESPTFTVSLQAIEEKLGVGFIPISRNTIVNLRHMVSCSTKNPKVMVMINGARLTVSRRRWQAVKKMLNY